MLFGSRAFTNRFIVIATLWLVSSLIFTSCNEPVDGASTEEDIYPISNGTGFGNVTESFDEPANTTLFNSSFIRDGNLSITGMYHKADFEDGTSQGWTLGSANIEDGHIRTWMDGSAQMAVSVNDFDLDLDLSMTKIDGTSDSKGFAIRLNSILGWMFHFSYDSLAQELVVAKQEYDEYQELKRVPFVGVKDQWYHVKIVHRGTKMTVTMDDQSVVDMFVSGITKMTLFYLSAQWTAEVLYDNVTIHAPSSKGHAYTPVVQRPFNRWWDKVELKVTTPGTSRVRVSVMDAYSGRPHFPEFENKSGSIIDITELIPTDSDRLFLDIWMIGNNWNWPIVEWVRITWKPAPPMFDGFPQEFELVEDTPVENIWNLTIGTWDWYVAKKNLTYIASYTSDPDHVMPVIDGWNLSIQLPTKDWFGNETIRIACSDGEFTTVGPNVTVTVNPVNDPPLFHDVGVLEVLEDQEWMVNVTDLVFDIDTPIEELLIQMNCDNGTMGEGRFLFNYPVGDVEDTFTLTVSDDEFQVKTTFDLRVINVNDAPVVMDIEDQLAIEEEEATVSLGSFLWDEDDPVEGLTVSSDDPYITDTNGTSLLFYHDEWMPARTIEFTVTDGKAWVKGSFVLEVEQVNDPPSIVGVGGRSVVGNLTFTMAEATTLWLALEVDDVDSEFFEYEVLTMLVGAMMHPNGTLEVSPARGVVDTYEAALTVDDQLGGWDEVVIRIVVENVNDSPEILSLSPENGTEYKEGETVTFSIQVQDVDGDDVTVTWMSDGVTLGTGKTLDHKKLKPGTRTIKVTVSDGETSVEDEFTVVITKEEESPGFAIGVICLALLTVVILSKRRSRP